MDEMEWVDTEEIREYIQGTLDMNGYDVFDEYGVPCNFHPSYEYHHEVEFYERPDGFEAEYDLTSGGELVYLRLQLKFFIYGRWTETHLPHDRSSVRCTFGSL